MKNVSRKKLHKCKEEGACCFGDVLREWREEKGMSRALLAFRLGVSERSLYNYERGRVKMPFEVLCRIGEVFGEEELKKVVKKWLRYSFTTST